MFDGHRVQAEAIVYICSPRIFFSNVFISQPAELIKVRSKRLMTDDSQKKLQNLGKAP
jgi:hypothetical protein